MASVYDLKNNRAMEISHNAYRSREATLSMLTGNVLCETKRAG
jgi:hypothetical protein